jgi:hypothetical protein
MDMIKLSRRRNQGRLDEAHRLPSSTYGRFSKGYDTTDMKIPLEIMESIA